ncbi:PQQ-dependent sugar dehydrogenase [Halobium salinum]|uniref:PQQ-dependent sugar dehydrogenase n=1 Tax=Halobium salinum TaxID=1364940 RepID=A0ABD5PIA4_9EURY
MGPTRRSFLRRGSAVATLGSLVGLTGCSQSVAPSADAGDGAAESSETNDSTTGSSPATDETADDGGTDAGPSVPESVALEPLVTGFQAPVAVVFPPDTSPDSPDRAYVVDQSGVVSLYESGELRDGPFLDLRDSLEFGGEKGLLGFALHPNFAGNRRLFVRYSAPRREGTPSAYSHTFVLAEFQAAADGRTVRRDSERTLLEIPEPQRNHNAGDVAFGPDGYLYVAVGDGGGGNDRGRGHVDDWYDPVPGGNGQDVTENLLGSILRIDVDSRSDGKPYGIPEDNPLVGTDGLDEHYAWGFRNPWRMSFDGEDLYVGDVGQGWFEEVDLVRAGGNYGWNVKEGTHCLRRESCPDRTPDSVRGGEPLLDPVVEYPHSGGEVSGISVIGGYVYRGSAVPGLRGRYVFADLNANGRLFVATPPDVGTGTDGRDGTEGGLWPVRALDVQGGERTLERVLSFGRDPRGELYVLGGGSGESGVYRVVAGE